MLWSIACYIVIAVGTAIYTRQTLGATYIVWPDWCFFLAFFSGVLWLIIAGVSLAGDSSSSLVRANAINASCHWQRGLKTIHQ